MEDLRLISTEDGSHSLYHATLDETYHSIHGAWQESMHVFIQNGLKWYYENRPNSNPIKIFEVGFGTGLNALLSCLFAENNSLKIDYHSIELFPIQPDIAYKLNYADKSDLQTARTSFLAMHAAPWNKQTSITDQFMLTKIQADFLSYHFDENAYDVIFYDAFAPSKQLDMWSATLIQKCADVLLPSGILVSYCARGQFKRDLKSAGMEVLGVPGPPGKFEMVRAMKP